MASRDQFELDSAQAWGSAIPGSGEPAFSLSLAEDARIPVLISAPHGGRRYPESVLARMRSPEIAAPRLEDRHVDLVARQVAAATGAALLVANAPRAMLDLNRAAEDVDWGMVAGKGPATVRHSLANRRARSGLGLVPRRLPGVGEVWRGPIGIGELEARIDGIHRPYHAALAHMLEGLRDRWGAVLLVDLHSMPPLKPERGSEKAAEFVIGDRYGVSCDPLLVAEAFRYLSVRQRLVAHNRPYAGGYVLDRHAHPARGIHALQFEICRSLYLDEHLDRPGAGLQPLVRLLSGMIRHLAARIVALEYAGSAQLAAE